MSHAACEVLNIKNSMWNEVEIKIQKCSKIWTCLNEVKIVGFQQKQDMTINSEF